MSNYEQEILDELQDEMHFTPRQMTSIEEVVNKIADSRAESAIYNMEYPDISDFVGDNFVNDILDAIDYEDIFKYVQEKEENKRDDN